MNNVVKRSSLVHVECPQCKRQITIAPVFHKRRNGERYEAWARFLFKKGKTGRGLCKIIYNNKEYAPSSVVVGIANINVDGWIWWKYEDEKGVITLDELSAKLSQLFGIS